jgi:uncharacterized protein YjbI with pentapeptide repeats
MFANLEGAYLADANLKGANLIRANLEGAYLADANLENAHLLEVNLEGANLRRAKVSEKHLVEVRARLNRTTMPDGSVYLTPLEALREQLRRLQDAPGGT